MARKSPTINDPSELRKSAGLNQTEFWKRFGVTQSGGSRYESGRSMPTPLKVLMQAWIDKLVDDAAMAKLLKKVAPGK
ncbi:MAG: helix-turn-helix transcriptional regulator [Sterolibacteriaceae bacterium]|jgi:transcriptional regulator with XRE-family HTH domain|nr:helix-turn-helix transcriptional regulator [Candidatus Methylophosphatis haderslevensis]